MNSSLPCPDIVTQKTAHLYGFQWNQSQWVEIDQNAQPLLALPDADVTQPTAWRFGYQNGINLSPECDSLIDLARWIVTSGEVPLSLLAGSHDYWIDVLKTEVVH
jgi:hypothetical protein